MYSPLYLRSDPFLDKVFPSYVVDMTKNVTYIRSCCNNLEQIIEFFMMIHSVKNYRLIREGSKTEIQFSDRDGRVFVYKTGDAIVLYEHTAIVVISSKQADSWFGPCVICQREGK